MRKKHRDEAQSAATSRCVEGSKIPSRSAAATRRARRADSTESDKARTRAKTTSATRWTTAKRGRRSERHRSWNEDLGERKCCVPQCADAVLDAHTTAVVETRVCYEVPSTSICSSKISPRRDPARSSALISSGRFEHDARTRSKTPRVWIGSISR